MANTLVCSDSQRQQPERCNRGPRSEVPGSRSRWPKWSNSSRRTSAMEDLRERWWCTTCGSHCSPGTGCPPPCRCSCGKSWGWTNLGCPGGVKFLRAVSSSTPTGHTCDCEWFSSAVPKSASQSSRKRLHCWIRILIIWCAKVCFWPGCQSRKWEIVENPQSHGIVNPRPIPASNWNRPWL